MSPPTVNVSRRGILIGVVLALVAAAMAVIPARPASADPICQSYRVIGVRGSGEGYVGPWGMGHRVGSYVERAADYMRSSGYSDNTGVSYTSLNYPAAGVETQDQWFQSEQDGINRLLRELRSEMARCPRMKFGLAGYSQGAQVVHDTLDFLSIAERARIKGVLLLADPKGDRGAWYARNLYHALVDTIYAPSHPGYGGMLGARRLPADIQGRVIDLCLWTDPVCSSSQGSSFVWRLVKAALFSADHGKYHECCLVDRNLTGEWTRVDVPTIYGRYFAQTMLDERGSDGGGTAPGPVNPPAPQPQPVTSVYGLADGTVLHTTDTQRIYKMVGGAPVWQATCDDGICLPQSRPTTQAVIDAGPRTPRDGSSAIDQRGRVYIFVGGAPLWQSHCNAPVNCGTPPKISNWSIDAREHMNQVPANGALLQGWESGIGTPVAMTAGGARINFASPQEVIDSGFGAEWHTRVVHVSGYAYHLLGVVPADGTLVQGAGAGGPTPVGMFVGGARINLASPQEVIEAGYGTDWASKVRAIPARAYHELHADIPADGTLIQGSGAGGPTPVAEMVGGARINYASPEEVVATGHGSDWRGKVRALPVRAFNLITTRMAEGTVVRAPDAVAGSDIHPAQVFLIAGGARIAIETEQEFFALGYQWDEVRLIPVRAMRELPTRMADGTVLRAPDAAAGSGIHPLTVFLLAGGARIPFASEEELFALGYRWTHVVLVPARVVQALPERIANGTAMRAPNAGNGDGLHPSSVYLAAGGGRLGIVSETELFALGYQWSDVVKVPARVLKAMPERIGDNTVFRAPDATAESGVSPNSVYLAAGGSRIGIHSQEELLSLGFGWSDVVRVPVRIVKAMPTALRDGTLIQGWANGSGTGIADVYGGKRFLFGNPAEVVASGFGSQWARQVVRVPMRVFEQTPVTPGAQQALVRPAGILAAGQRLAAGDSVVLPDGQYRLVMQPDGNLVLYTADSPQRGLWSTGTSGQPGATAILQRDGNLVVQAADNSVLWSSGTGGRPDAEYRLAVQSDANVVIYTPAGQSIWASGRYNTKLPAGSTLKPGWSLRAAGTRSYLAMQGDGNLVFFAPDGRALWSSRTAGHPGARAVMQRDGNLVVLAPDNGVLWNSGTGGNPEGAYELSVRDDGSVTVGAATVLWRNTTLPSLTAGERDKLLPEWRLRSQDGRYTLVMQSDGNLVEYGPDGAPIWSTRTTHPGARAVMQTDGNLVLYTASGAAVWSSGTSGRPNAAYKLVAQNDGNVVIYGPDGAAIWDRNAA